MFQVGLAQSPDRDDPMFTTKSQAIQHALSQNEDHISVVYAVWDVTKIGYAETVCLIFQGDIYKA